MKLVVRSSTEKWKYDIHSLVKAFYPAAEVKVLAPGDPLPAGISIQEGQPVSDAPLCTISLDLDLEQKNIIMRRIPSAGETKDGSQPLAAVSAETAWEGDSPRDAMKQLIYRELVRETGTELPWGAQTGIRPVRVPMDLLSKGISEEDILRHMKDVYYISDEKAALALEIAGHEQKLLSETHGTEGYSLYLNIPFCPTRCLYCSFAAEPVHAFRGRIESYLDCMAKELDYVREAFAGRPLDTVYIGGGTPTALTADQMDRLLTMLTDRIDLSNTLEFTVESGRPDSLTADKLRVMKRFDVSRISVNPQTMRDETLQRIGRLHTVQQTREAFALARAEGFDNINMDIILGLPGEKPSDVDYTIEEIRKLSPDDLTVHALAVKRASKLAELLRDEKLEYREATARISEMEEMTRIAEEGARSMGLVPYYLYRQKNMTGNFENTGYTRIRTPKAGAKRSGYGYYNVITMEETQSIVAIGAGSVSKRVYGAPTNRIERCEDMKDVNLYMEHVDEMIERKRRLYEN